MLDIEHGHVYVFLFNITQTRNRFFNLLKSTHLKSGSGLLKLLYLVVEFTKKPVPSCYYLGRINLVGCCEILGKSAFKKEKKGKIGFNSKIGDITAE